MKTRVIVFSEKMLGDIIVQSTAAVNIRLADPGAYIVLSCPPQYQSAIAGAGVWDEIWPFSRKLYKTMSPWKKLRYFWGFVFRIRRGRFTHAIVFDAYDRAALFAFLGGIPVRAGLAGGALSFLLNRKYAKSENDEDFRNFYLGTTQAAGFAIRTKKTSYIIQPESRRQAAALLKRESLAAGSFVAIHLGASGEDRRWPAEKFRKLFESPALKKTNLRVLFLSGPGEDEILSAYSRAFAGSPLLKRIRFLGDCSFQNAAALFAAAKLVLVFDSSPRHLAAALGVKTLAFISDWKLKTWKLYDEREDQFVVVGHGIEPVHGIRNIEVSEVASSLRKLLRQRKLNG